MARTIRITLAVLALLFLLNTLASTATFPSLIILPPANKSGAPTLDWLASSIQDTMNVDLWGMSRVRTRAVTEYGNLMGYNVGRSALDAEAAVKLAREAHVDIVWRGKFALTDKDTIILTYWALDSKNGAMLHKQEIEGPLGNIASLISRMTLSLLAPSGIPATKQETDSIAKTKTTSVKAFEQNSLCFG